MKILKLFLITTLLICSGTKSEMQLFRSCEISLQNMTKRPVFVAIAYKSIYKGYKEKWEGYISEGWQEVNPNQTKLISIISHNVDKYYLYVENEQGKKWTGDKKFLTYERKLRSRSNRTMYHFSYKDADLDYVQERERNSVWSDFFEVGTFSKKRKQAELYILRNE